MHDLLAIEKILATRALAKRDLMVFFKHFAWPVVEPSTPLAVNWAMELMADHLMALGRRQIPGNALLANLPPRHSKSSLCTIAFPMWLWLQDPSERFIHSSYNLQLARLHSTYRRDIVKSPGYQMLRPISLKGKDTQAYFQNHNQGYSLVVPRDKATGNGATGLILDDLHSTADGATEIARGVHSYKKGLRSRLNQTNSFKLIVMQRVGESDVAQAAIEEGYYHLNIPAECNKRRIYTFFSGRTVEVPENTLIDESRLTDSVTNLKKDAVVWATQYLQTPRVDGGAVFKMEHFQKSDELNSAQHTVRILSVDTASSTKEYSARWAFEVFDYSDPAGAVALRTVHADKYEYFEGKQKLMEMIGLFKPNIVLIENKSTGISLISDLPVELGYLCPQIVPIKPKHDKLIRAAIASASIRKRNFSIPKEAPWLEDFLNECNLFPLSQYMDQVDALSQFFIWLDEEQSEAKKVQGSLFTFA